jgi:succinate-semialdehyde dehydrogenase / glutarate-semialdehyde dehydrogenase
MKLKDPTLLRQQCYINGKWVGEGALPVRNPADNSEIAQVPQLDAAATREAIECADKAYRSWSKLPAKERGKLLRRWYDLMQEHREDLAMIMTMEQGKPLAEALGEVDYSSSFTEFFAEEAKRIYGDTIPGPRADGRIVVIKQASGVVAAITPWNFPMAMITRKVSPALAAGCAVVCKPASDTPLTALALAELADRAGIPAGIFNVITGPSGAVGGELTANPLVRVITFTGSTEVGKLLMEQSAKTVKRVALELGGNAPFIVFDDADIDAAVTGAMIAKFRNAGQTCVCANRIFVQDGVYDTFAERLATEVMKLKVGAGTEVGVQQGPLINEQAVTTVEAHVADAVGMGAKVAVGGARHALGGTFFEPTILTNVSTKMLVSREETFGPVAPLFRFKTEEEAVKLANDTEYGLAAYFYSRDVGRCWRVAEALEYGMVGINEGLISNEVAPFGGVKESGLGREGGHYGVEEFVEMKYMYFGGIQDAE